MHVQNHTRGTASILLAGLADNIRNFQAPVDRYLGQAEGYEAFSPFASGIETRALLMDTRFPDALAERLGIRHIVSNSEGRTASRGNWPVVQDEIPYGWNNLKSDALIDRLGTLISHCTIIQFADWATTDDASGLWDGLFTNVIKPLRPWDVDFIFRLGDTSGRPVFKVDEALDIMGDYATRGRVSLVLDEAEAGRLLTKIHSAAYKTSVYGSGLRSVQEKYLFLFNIMCVDRLVILYGNRTLLFSKHGAFDFKGGPLNLIHSSIHNRDYFPVGFRLGLLLHLDVPHCIVLGQVVAGAYQAGASMPNAQALLAYIDAWRTTYS